MATLMFWVQIGVSGEGVPFMKCHKVQPAVSHMLGHSTPLDGTLQHFAALCDTARQQHLLACVLSFTKLFATPCDKKPLPRIVLGPLAFIEGLITHDLLDVVGEQFLWDIVAVAKTCCDKL